MYYILILYANIAWFDTLQQTFSLTLCVAGEFGTALDLLRGGGDTRDIAGTRVRGRAFLLRGSEDIRDVSLLIIAQAAKAMRRTTFESKTNDECIFYAYFV